jgi:hypothetical protein
VPGQVEQVRLQRPVRLHFQHLGGTPLEADALGGGEAGLDRVATRACTKRWWPSSAPTSSIPAIRASSSGSRQSPGATSSTAASTLTGMSRPTIEAARSNRMQPGSCARAGRR